MPIAAHAPECHVAATLLKGFRRVVNNKKCCDVRCVRRAIAGVSSSCGVVLFGLELHAGASLQRLVPQLRHRQQSGRGGRRRAPETITNKNYIKNNKKYAQDTVQIT